ncbi:MAG: DUF559 domain-containing protein [Pseudolysinimonas sp.]
MTQRNQVDRIHLGRPLTFDELTDAGISRSRIRASDVDHPFRGVHLIGGKPSGLRERCEALLPVLRAREAFSHLTAAALLGAPVPRSSRIHVTTGAQHDRMRRPGVVGHRAADLPVMLHLGLPIVAPAHAWFQLATLLGHDDLVAVGDYLVTPNRRRQTPAIASIDALRAAIPERARGAARARRALSDVRVGAESRMETLLRLLLMRSGLPEPLLNPPVDVGVDTLHPDLLYPEWRVALEYEGDHHRTDPQQWRHDIWRREAFEDAGFRVIRVHRDDVLKEPEALLARVCRVLALRRSGTLDAHPRDGGRLSE